MKIDTNTFRTLLFVLLGLRSTLLWCATDVWVSHVSSQGGWKTGLSVYYSGAESAVPYTCTRVDESGTALPDGGTFTAANNAWNPVPGTLLEYEGSARIRSEKQLLVKVSYRYGESLSLCEFYAASDTGQEWVLPNSALAWFDWTGIALVNSSGTGATATLEAWKQGARIASRSILLQAQGKFAATSDAIWNGVTLRDFDTTVIRASVPVPAPICITGNFSQDRHVFFTAQQRPQNERALYLINGTLIDGTGGKPVQDAVVGVRSGRIIAAGKRADIAIPSQAETLDVQGGFILPGFINTHVHNAISVDRLRAWVQAGVTTVRDVGAYQSPSVVFGFRESVRADPSCARLVAAGPLVTVPGGYPIAGNNFPALTVLSPEDARAKIGTLLDEGADLIKISLERGPGWPVLAPEEVRAIVDTAHARGVPVAAHITNTQYLRVALEAGVDDSAHSVTDFLPDALIERMVGSEMALVPTLTAQRKSGSTLGNLKRFSDAGGKVALGNDAGYMAGLEIGMPMSELEAMQEAGLSPMQIIVASTRNSAEVCRLGKTLGTIEFDKEADILTVRSNPLDDLRALLEVEHVIRGGSVIR